VFGRFRVGNQISRPHPVFSVHRGFDLERPGFEVVIKIAQRPDDDSFACPAQQMRNENALLTGPLVDCLGVPSVLAFGEDVGRSTATGQTVRLLVLVEHPLGFPVPDQLDVQQLTDFTRKLSTTLVAVHQCGVVHSDVKPDNVVMVGDQPILIDFGVSFLANEPKTQHGVSDVYAAYELLETPDLSPSADTDFISLTFTLQALEAGVRKWELEAWQESRPPLDRGHHAAVQNCRYARRSGTSDEASFLHLLDALISDLQGSAAVD
jgi:hypothetical protein